VWCSVWAPVRRSSDSMARNSPGLSQGRGTPAASRVERVARGVTVDARTARGGDCARASGGDARAHPPAPGGGVETNEDRRKDAATKEHEGSERAEESEERGERRREIRRAARGAGGEKRWRTRRSDFRDEGGRAVCVPRPPARPIRRTPGEPEAPAWFGASGEKAPGTEVTGALCRAPRGAG